MLFNAYVVCVVLLALEDLHLKFTFYNFVGYNLKLIL